METCAFLVVELPDADTVVAVVVVLAVVAVPLFPSFRQQLFLPLLLDQPWRSTPSLTLIRHHLFSSCQFSNLD